MKKRLISLIITGLTVILLFNSYTIYKNINKQSDKIESNLIDEKVVNNMNELDKESLISKLNTENSLNVISGNCTVKVTYSNEEDFSGKEFEWIRTKFDKLDSKTLKSSNTYKFSFSYDLNDLPIETRNNIAYITLSKNRLTLSQVELIDINQECRVGLFEKYFSPNEINSINNRVKKIAANEIQSDNEIRLQAMNNLQDNIKQLLNCECEFILSDYDVVEQDKYEIVSTNY